MSQSAGNRASASRAVRARRGATMVEYSLMLALIAVVLIVVVSALSGQLKVSFSRVSRAVDDAVAQADAAATDAGDTAPTSAMSAGNGNNNGNGNNSNGNNSSNNNQNSNNSNGNGTPNPNSNANANANSNGNSNGKKN